MFYLYLRRVSSVGEVQGWFSLRCLLAITEVLEWRFELSKTYIYVYLCGGKTCFAFSSLPFSCGVVFIDGRYFEDNLRGVVWEVVQINLHFLFNGVSFDWPAWPRRQIEGMVS